ncbi:hypothetical protein PCANC_15555 [Puccinia coronata f. sp. avenae]|uniref:Uncharacterized protein n=1 Tax=Puccinia coronata f. sp. avenae TaxID=200324 RepID=A0A2N5SX92_9BASI|nr:hypothetical protein PCANC_15555 [Puccinia coronata f. sp. avenae]
MAPSASFVLCVCPKCSTTQVINKFNQQSVPGRYWKKNSVTYRQHLQELRQNTSRAGPSGNTLSIVNMQESDVVQETRKIDIIAPEPEGGKSSKSKASGQNFWDVGRERLDSSFNIPKSQLLRLPAQILGAVLLFKKEPAARNASAYTLRTTNLATVLFVQLQEVTSAEPHYLFLNRPGIEEHLESSVNHISPNGVMQDIWDSPRWKEYKDSEGGRFTRCSNNLVFSLNVDWFNPSGNKITGKHWSVGTIAMTCLNLPPLLRNRPKNIFLAGLIPGPSEPKLEKINHLLQPLVSELLSLWKGCLIHPTLTSPIDGRIIRVQLGPVICDLPAIRKVLGLAGHSSANHLCQFCNLPYFNLLDDTVVEPMHNIFLGLLRNHGTEFFGLKKKEGWNDDQSDSEALDRLEHQENMSDLDYDANDSNKNSLSGGTNRSPSAQPMTVPPLNNDNGTHLETMRLFEAFEDLALFESEQEEILSSNVPHNNAVLPGHPNADSHADIYEYNQVDSPLFAITDNLQHLCTIRDEIHLPSHIGRIPATTSSSPHEDINSQFSNLLLLVSITNLVQQNKIINEDIDSLAKHLKVYRQGILRLYPQFTTKPNHHLALHLPKDILHMGPAPYWTAWAFERLNGSLAKIPMNNQIGKLNSTLLVKWATAQNFRGILPSLGSLLPQKLCNSIEELSNPLKNLCFTNSNDFTPDANISN